MSAPVSATITSAVVCEIPGIEVMIRTAASKGTRRAAISAFSSPIEASKRILGSVHEATLNGPHGPRTRLQIAHTGSKSTR